MRFSTGMEQWDDVMKPPKRMRDHTVTTDPQNFFHSWIIGQKCEFNGKQSNLSPSVTLSTRHWWSGDCRFGPSTRWWESSGFDILVWSCRVRETDSDHHCYLLKLLSHTWYLVFVMVREKIWIQRPTVHTGYTPPPSPRPDSSRSRVLRSFSPSVLTFSLSLYQHPIIYLLWRSRITSNK